MPTVKFLVADSDLCALVVAMPQTDNVVGTKGGSAISEDRAFGGTSGIADGESGEGRLLTEMVRGRAALVRKLLLL